MQKEIASQSIITCKETALFTPLGPFYQASSLPQAPLAATTDHPLPPSHTWPPACIRLHLQQPLVEVESLRSNSCLWPTCL